MNLRQIMQNMDIGVFGDYPKSLMPVYSYHHKGDISNEGQKIDPNTHPHNIAVVISTMLRYGVEGDVDTVNPIAEDELNLMDHAELAIARHNKSNTRQLEVPDIEDVFNYLPQQITNELKHNYGL